MQLKGGERERREEGRVRMYSYYYWFPQRGGGGGRWIPFAGEIPYLTECLSLKFSPPKHASQVSKTIYSYIMPWLIEQFFDNYTVLMSTHAIFLTYQKLSISTQIWQTSTWPCKTFTEQNKLRKQTVHCSVHCTFSLCILSRFMSSSSSGVNRLSSGNKLALALWNKHTHHHES